MTSINTVLTSPPTRAPIVAEFVGPAGVGKTTLIRTLKEQHELSVGVQLRKPHYLPLVLGELPELLPAVLARGPFLRRDLRSIGYLSAWQQALSEGSPGTTYCFDHGPVFRLALLREFGSAPTQHPHFQRWWQRTLEQWAAKLTLIVWLDAPDAILVERINERPKDHLFKGKGETETLEFLGRFRRSFDEIVTIISSASGSSVGGPTLLRLNTYDKPVDETVADLLMAFRSS